MLGGSNTGLKMTVTKLSQNHEIYYATFNSQYELTTTLIRIQEFYESDNDLFINKFFTLDQYMDWYASTHNGEFTYFTDWNGFNIPGEVIQAWNKIMSVSTIRDKELDFLRKVPLYNKDKWYVIASHGKASPHTFEHEVAHALWYLDEDYKAKCLDLIRTVPTTMTDALVSWIRSKGYGENVITDELNAYLSTQDHSSLSEIFGCVKEDVVNHTLPLRDELKMRMKDINHLTNVEPDTTVSQPVNPECGAG